MTMKKERKKEQGLWKEKTEKINLLRSPHSPLPPSPIGSTETECGSCAHIVQYIYGIYFYGFYFYGTYFYKVKKKLNY